MDRRKFLETAAVTTLAASLGSAKAQETKRDPAIVDAREFALIAVTKPVLEGDPKLMQFDVEKLPAGKVELHLDATQIYQLAEIDEKGKLRGLVLPKKDGSVKIYQLQPGTEVDLKIFANKDKDAQPIKVSRTFTYDENYNYVKGQMDQIEKNRQTKTAPNNFAVEFFDGKKTNGGLRGNYEVAKTSAPFTKDFANYDLNWDGAVQQRLEASLKVSPERK